MPFHILRNDIANMRTDAIVNTANPMPVVGDGVDAAIHKKAGPQLLAERKKIGQLRPGDCVVTPAFGLDAQYVIHAVGPVWRGGLLGEGRVLRKCYEDALKLAVKHGCGSIAFPLISTGTYGFPRERAMHIALNAINGFLLKNEMDVYLVVFDKESHRLSEGLFADVASYIDDNYAGRIAKGFDANRRRMDAGFAMAPMAASMDSCVMAMPPFETDAGFSETLLKLIDRSGRKDSEIYRRANVSRQHFSKIRKNPGYQPTKATALAFAIALELDLEDTEDLIGRAGFALTRASKFDVIIMYFIERRIYDILTINECLFEFDQSLLG